MRINLRPSVWSIINYLANRKTEPFHGTLRSVPATFFLQYSLVADTLRLNILASIFILLGVYFHDPPCCSSLSLRHQLLYRCRHQKCLQGTRQIDVDLHILSGTDADPARIRRYDRISKDSTTSRTGAGINV